AKRKEANRLMQYVAERQPMIRYPEFRRRGWQIGSGPTESECKTTTHRIKGRGRRWNGDNAEATMALACLDEVFLTRTYVDEFYRARRDNTTLVARSCPAPGPNCFCSSMGVDPMQPAGADVILHDLGEAWGWEPVTERGQQLTSRVRDLLQDGGFEKPQAGAFAIELDMQGVPEKLAALFEHPLWEELAARCMNCGICTYVCPSCYCFDIQVKNRGSEGYRFRCWDSCMYYEYSKMAGGHNPRERKADRFRNRFLHKLEFFHERYGSLLCTGCGRCMAMCPHGVNIVTLIERVREVEGHV
ncbi:MAG: 4Fe-4S dicluster domain-containing protein, partial [Syntrophomonadaceae bacterium]|nr:4Fe-4S dicluster domain-containing protein [Syntrophomonadaceae bacterium]